LGVSIIVYFEALSNVKAKKNILAFALGLSYYI